MFLLYLSFRLYLPVESMKSFNLIANFLETFSHLSLPESEYGASISEEKKSTPKITPDGTYAFCGTLLRDKFSWSF